MLCSYIETISSKVGFLGLPGVHGSSKAIGDNFSISLSVNFADSDNVCGIFILSRKSKTQSTNELNEFFFKPRYSLSFDITLTRNLTRIGMN